RVCYGGGLDRLRLESPGPSRSGERRDAGGELPFDRGAGGQARCPTRVRGRGRHGGRCRGGRDDGLAGERSGIAGWFGAARGRPEDGRREARGGALMAIYGRTGNVVTVVRRAVLSDVKLLDGRRPDKQD